MPSPGLWAGALNLVLRHHMTGCSLAAHQAATLLERIAGCPEVDDDTRALCEQASLHLDSPIREDAPCSPPL